MKFFIVVFAALGLLSTVEAAVTETSSSSVYIISTNLGDITIELDDGPTVTTDNFEAYAQDGFYDGTIFHRVIKGFMVQGGGFSPEMVEKVTDVAAIINEGSLCGSNVRGSLAMARTSDPHSATAQFFINTVDNPFLNFKEETIQGWGYCSFGHVTDGMDIVDEIEAMPTKTVGPYQDVPATPVIIESVTLVEITE
jgi:peptidyl-prolyl cis-trans isomerase B (cyclophilin B)